MGTTVAQDNTRFDTRPGSPAVAKVGAAPGTIVLAGTLWPAENTVGGKLTRDDVRAALQEARALSQAGLVMAAAAVAGGPEAAALMQTWFGPRPVNGRDWWLAVKENLTRINAYMLSDIHVYYRGADALGKANDYPGAAGLLDAYAVAGYAESGVGVQNGIIGLCKLFFAGTHDGERKIKKIGFDSVGGVLIHELSHNVAATIDHEAPAGGTCYGTAKCLNLAVNRPSRAWYNADNLEYFCEQALYGKVLPKSVVDTEAADSVAAVSGALTAAPPPAPPKPPIGTGAQRGIGELVAEVTADKPVPPKQPVTTGAQRGIGELTAEVTADKPVPPKPAVTTGSGTSVKDLKDNFK